MERLHEGLVCQVVVVLNSVDCTHVVHGARVRRVELQRAGIQLKGLHQRAANRPHTRLGDKIAPEHLT